jgi:hypothetical protein
MPVGSITRGTTNTNRLRRVDRWIAEQPALLHAVDPFIVDLGHGASGVTTFELAARLGGAPARRGGARPRDRSRAGANGERAARRIRSGDGHFPADLPVAFGLGGFEVPTPDGRRPAVIRAFNVLRQYDEADVDAAWRSMAARLAPAGSSSRARATSSAASRAGSASRSPVRGPSPSACADPASRRRRWWPSACRRRSSTERGRRAHPRPARDARLRWRVHAPMSVYGGSQRWIAAVATMRHEGWPVIGGPRRARLGELTVPWDAVAPR